MPLKKGQDRQRGLALGAGRFFHRRLAAGIGLAHNELSIQADGYSRRHSFFDFTAAAVVMPVVALGAASGAGPQAASRMAIRMSRLAFNPMVFIAVIGDIPM